MNIRFPKYFQRLVWVFSEQGKRPKVNLVTERVLVQYIHVDTLVSIPVAVQFSLDAEHAQ